MTTTCADIVTRALALSVANQGLLDVNATDDVQDALVRINSGQQLAWTEFTAQNRTAYLTTSGLSSSAGNGGRTIDLTVADPPVQRIVRVTRRSDGVDVALVDPAIPNAEMSPRYYTQGSTLVEVSTDWDSSTTDNVVLDVLYVSRCAELDVSATADLTQAVSIPDRFTNVLVYDLGVYLCEKDVGRSDAEVAALQAKRDQALQDWITAEAQLGGTMVYTFAVPVPTPSSKN